MPAQSLRTVSQLANAFPAFSEPALRRLIFDAEINGLANAIVRIGRRVYVDLALFEEWVERHRITVPQPPKLSRYHRP